VTTLLLIGIPLIKRLGGAKYRPTARFSLPLLADYRKKSGRCEYVRGKIATDLEFGQGVQKAGKSGAAIISSLAAADGLIEFDADIENVTRGTLCRFIPFFGLLG
ncbi:MAG: hypothetical protein AAF352_07735, partial [Pseudomonadota bacterium]